MEAKTSKYYILKDGDSLSPPFTSFELVDGVRVRFKGFENFDFFIWKNTEDNIYSVTESSTGLVINSDRYKKRAVKKACETLKRVGKKRLKNDIKYNLDTYGISPRYL